jgi:hypothetical protein
MPNEISIDDSSAEELSRLQQDVVSSQAKVMDLVSILAAYSALPVSLLDLVQNVTRAVAARDEKIKKVAALGGVDLDSPNETDRWGWSPQERVLRKVG